MTMIRNKIFMADDWQFLEDAASRKQARTLSSRGAQTARDLAPGNRRFLWRARFSTQLGGETSPLFLEASSFDARSLGVCAPRDDREKSGAVARGRVRREFAHSHGDNDMFWRILIASFALAGSILA